MLNILVGVTFLLFIGYAILIVYYRQSWLQIHDHQPLTTDHRYTTTISIIIPARNEEENIKDCLHYIAKQSYPKNLFTVIVVDDFSTDRTADVVSSFPEVQLISLNNFVSEKINSYKKKAIEVAIQNSTGELIVTTDADCIVPENWLQTIASFYEKEQATFIAMPVLISNGNKCIEIFQSLDFMTLQGITGASVNKKFHSMCNGANLAYTRQAFEEVDGFKNIDAIASGDDMLLMHKIAERYPDKVKFLKSTKVIVQTKPVASISEFFNQRIRWASKADKYNDKSILPVLVVVYFLNLLMLVLPIAAFIQNVHFSFFTFHFSFFEVWILLLVLKTSVELFFLLPVASFFNRKKLLWWFPVAQPFHILYTIIAGWLGKFGSYQWKERKVK